MGGSVCLCNRIHLFQGEDCSQIPPLAFVATFVYTTHACFALFCLASATLRLWRRRLTNQASRMALLSCAFFTMSIAIFCGLYIFDLCRLFDSNLDDRWWESEGCLQLTGVALIMATLHILTLAKTFLKTLVSVGVVGKTGAKVWSLLIHTHQVVSAAVYTWALFFGIFQTFAIIWILTMVITILIMMWAAVKTHKFLAASDLEMTQPSIFQAQKSLFIFVSSFRIWVSAFAVAGFVQTFSDAVTTTPALVPHLAHFFAVEALNQLGVCVADYFIRPEKRHFRPVDSIIGFALQALKGRRSAFSGQHIVPVDHTTNQTYDFQADH